MEALKHINKVLFCDSLMVADMIVLPLWVKNYGKLISLSIGQHKWYLFSFSCSEISFVAVSKLNKLFTKRSLPVVFDFSPTSLKLARASKFVDKILYDLSPKCNFYISQRKYSIPCLEEIMDNIEIKKRQSILTSKNVKRLFNTLDSKERLVRDEFLFFEFEYLASFKIEDIDIYNRVDDKVNIPRGVIATLSKRFNITPPTVKKIIVRRIRELKKSTVSQNDAIPKAFYPSMYVRKIKKCVRDGEYVISYAKNEVQDA